MTIDEKINRLRESAEKYRANTNAEPQNSFEAEAKKVAELLEETVPNDYFYISEHKVQDVSVKAVKYADEWEPYDYENLYFTREEAEAALERKRGEKCW